MIEVGEYIRTSNGIIAKLERIKSELRYKYWANNGECYTEKAIKKHSFNIIDLIEKGDYVNGFLIDYIDLDCKVPFLRSERPYREATTWYKDLIEKGKDYNMCLHFKQEDIKSIVTKEQFKNTEYVI